jgi:ABC-type nickel/cobalt efflux system permease component RcnA
MLGLFSIIALGFFLGMRHATDPDHVIAVTTIVSREKRISTSAWIGVFWGIGHTLTIFAIGTAIIAFDLVIPPRLGLGMELSVGLMLIVLGAMNVLSFIRGLPAPIEKVPSSAGQLGAEVVHSHVHAHGDYVHTHPHAHSPERHPHTEQQTPVARLDRILLKFRPYHPIRPLIVGIVHGMAGSAGVALLVLTTVHNPRWAVAYLLVFGLGTIAGMMLITMSIGSAFRLVSDRHFFRKLAFVSGLLSIGFGLFVGYQILGVSGLMNSNPHWITH